ncbi:hypothetical protein GQ42DRAFT_157513 [Ramicandelaber brevisporus]|nr:hypothetical protein GQ42DRAFT_157513 [Ramicandelaber brevisporus]
MSMDDIRALVVDSAEYPDLPSGVPMPKIPWRGSRLKVDGMPYAELLGAADRHSASILRLHPASYLLIKRQLLDATRQAEADGVVFSKTLAQKAVHINGSKASRLHAFFGKLGWIPRV